VNRNTPVTHIPEQVVEFSCEVEDDGYEWVRGKPMSQVTDPEARDELFLVPANRNPNRIVTRYSPLFAKHALFRQFSETDPNEDGILRFATEFGSLGGEVATGLILNSVVTFGETMAAWWKEIYTMRHALRLWDLVNAHDEAELRRHIKWAADGSGVQYQSYPDLADRRHTADALAIEIESIASKYFHRETLAVLVPGDVFRPAMMRVQAVINKRLAGRASPRLLWDRSLSELSVHLAPDGLVGALWLQFAQAVAGDRTFRSCGECKRWYETYPDSARADRQYCSDACRVRAYRRRKNAKQAPKRNAVRG
jgi:hypothetical protein